MSPMSPRLLRPRQSLHPEAADWAARVTAAGATYSGTTLTAVSKFCRSIDAAGIRSKFLRVNLFCGNSITAALIPLYRSSAYGGAVVGNATDTNNNFVSADFQETQSGGGLKGNGTTKYLNTGLTPNDIPTQTSVHVSFSATDLETASTAYNTTGDRFIIGSYATAENTVYDMAVTAFINATANVRMFRVGSFNNVASTSSTGRTSESHMLGTQTSATSLTLYADGQSVGSNSTARSPVGSTRPWYVFAHNLNNTAGLFTAARMRMYSIGNGITASEALAFRNAVVAFNTSLARA